MRPIDADALIAKCGDWYTEEGTEEGFIGTIRDMVDSIPTIDPELKWIPCSERLPEDGTYIVYAPDYTGGSSSAKECHNGIMFSKIKNGKWSIEHGYHKRPNCVWAWMPLPEPYQEGGQDEPDKQTD